MDSIFVSYAREDKDWVRDLVTVIEAAGHDVFWDVEIPTGSTWEQYIGQKLKVARCIVVVWSKDSVESEWVAREAAIGRSKKNLIPLLLDGAPPPWGYQDIQAADFSDWNGSPDAPEAVALVEHIREMIADKAISAPDSPPGDPDSDAELTGLDILADDRDADGGEPAAPIQDSTTNQLKRLAIWGLVIIAFVNALAILFEPVICGQWPDAPLICDGNPDLFSRSNVFELDNVFKS